VSVPFILGELKLIFGSFADGAFIARPVVGGHFALLALNSALTTGPG
jgi:hypothetical protein